MIDGDTMQDGTFVDTNLTLSQGQRLIVEASVGFTAESWNHGFIPNKYVVGVLKATVTEPYDFSDFDYAVVYESQDLSTDLHMTSIYQGLTRVADMSQISQAGGDGAIEISDDGTEIAFIADLPPAGSSTTVLSNHRLSSFHDVHFVDGENYGATPRKIAIAVIGRDGDLPISGSSFTGISTITNPAISIDGLTHKNGSVDYSFTGGMQSGTWVAISETLGAGQRAVFNSDFLQDLFDNMSIGDYLYIGTEDSTFNGANGISNFRRDDYTSIYKQSATELSIQAYSNSSQQFTQIINESNLTSNYSFSIELTYSGNNVRSLYNFNHSQDITTSSYADWTSSKIQTGNQGWGLLSVNIIMYYSNSNANTLDLRPFDIVGDVIEYIVPIPNLTLEGPSSNQSGSEIQSVSQGHGWASVDDQLSAGQRLVMNNAFFSDLLGEMGDQYEILIGLKGTNWANTSVGSGSNQPLTGEVFRGNTHFRIYRSTNHNIYFEAYSDGGVLGSTMLLNTAALHQTACAFLEVTSDGNEIRLGFGRNNNLGVNVGDEATVAYADWNSYKLSTGSQSYGISNIDVVILVHDIFNGNDVYDGANVDWTNLSIISLPTSSLAVTNFNKALDFNGGSEHAIMNVNGSLTNQMRQNGTGVSMPSTGMTSSSTYSRPFAISVIFKHDGNTSNQVIWAQCENNGTGSSDDQIFLGLSGTGVLTLNWGRSGSMSQKQIGTAISGFWYAVYIDYNGFKSGSPTVSEMAQAFRIKLIVSSTVNNITGNWNSANRMTRLINGNFYIGGRGSNRSYNGKIAALVVTALNWNSALPTDTEIVEMVTNPNAWLDNYKVGNNFRVNSTNYSNFQKGNVDSGYNTQVYLMGDGSSDVYPDINNVVTARLDTKLIMQNMAANDIETITLTGII